MVTLVTFNMMVVMFAVLIHYEFLYRITGLLPRMRIRQRLRIVAIVLITLTGHAVEVWMFAISYFFIHHGDGWGHLQGNFDGTLLDCVYFSFTTYTTLGMGDIEPIGKIRYLVGLEGLSGLVLVTWTASFIYLEMTRYWETD